MLNSAHNHKPICSICYRKTILAAIKKQKSLPYYKVMYFEKTFTESCIHTTGFYTLLTLRLSVWLL